MSWDYSRQLWRPFWNDSIVLSRGFIVLETTLTLLCVPCCFLAVECYRDFPIDDAANDLLERLQVIGKEPLPLPSPGSPHRGIIRVLPKESKPENRKRQHEVKPRPQKVKKEKLNPYLDLEFLHRMAELYCRNVHKPSSKQPIHWEQSNSHSQEQRDLFKAGPHPRRLPGKKPASTTRPEYRLREPFNHNRNKNILQIHLIHRTLHQLRSQQFTLHNQVVLPTPFLHQQESLLNIIVGEEVHGRKISWTIPLDTEFLVHKLNLAQR